MKAIDLIGQMVYDSALAENGLVYEYLDGFYTWTTWTRRLFGGNVESGELKNGHYFCLYEDNYDFRSLPEPDVVVDAHEAGKVYLWQITQE